MRHAEGIRERKLEALVRGIILVVFFILALPIFFVVFGMLDVSAPFAWILTFSVSLISLLGFNASRATRKVAKALLSRYGLGS